MPDLFSSITERMALILNCYYEKNDAPFFYLFPFIDVRNFGELRVTVTKKKAVRAQWLHRPENIKTTPALLKAVTAFMEELIETCCLNTLYLDIFILPENYSYVMHIGEVNPIMARAREELFSI